MINFFFPRVAVLVDLPLPFCFFCCAAGLAAILYSGLPYILQRLGFRACGNPMAMNTLGQGVADQLWKIFFRFCVHFFFFFFASINARIVRRRTVRFFYVGCHGGLRSLGLTSVSSKERQTEEDVKRHRASG